MEANEFISIHTTLAGGDECVVVNAGPQLISIHTTLAGGDYVAVYEYHHAVEISIHTTLAGGDRTMKGGTKTKAGFQSTPPSRVATFFAASPALPCLISIHTTLAGGDERRRVVLLDDCISIHTTLAGGDLLNGCVCAGLNKFQSTPPSRVATRVHRHPARPACISIHTTLAGGDACGRGRPAQAKTHFNPHHPRGWRPSAMRR